MDPTLSESHEANLPELEFDEAELAALDAQFLQTMEAKKPETGAAPGVLTPNQWASIAIIIAFASVFIFCIVWIVKTQRLRAQRQYLERAGFAVNAA